jgi:glutaredoxin
MFVLLVENRFFFFIFIMKSSLKAIILEGCPYSIAAVELLNTHNIKFIKKMVNQKTKHKYKTDKINTFPQIYLNNILIGGYDTTKELLEKINNSNNLDELKDELKIKFNKFNNKEILRLIKIFLNH